MARYLLIVAPLSLTAAVGLTRNRGLRTLAAVVLLALAVLPGQVAVRGMTAKNGSDYRTAARIIERDQQPGDAVVYTAQSRTMRAGLDSYLRHYRSRPGDLLLASDAAGNGTLRADEYPDAAPRVWLLVYGKHPDPTAVRRELQPVLRRGFRRPASGTCTGPPRPVHPDRGRRIHSGGRAMSVVVRWWRPVLPTAGVLLAVVQLPGRLPGASSTWTELRAAAPIWLLVVAALQIVSMAAFAEQRRHLLAAFGVRMRSVSSLAVSYVSSATATALPCGSAVSAGYSFRQYRAPGPP